MTVIIQDLREQVVISVFYKLSEGNWLEDRMPRRMTASSLCLSVAALKPHHALDAYVMR